MRAHALIAAYRLNEIDYCLLFCLKSVNCRASGRACGLLPGRTRACVLGKIRASGQARASESVVGPGLRNVQKPDAKKKLLAASVILRKVVMDILNKSFGWNMHMRLEAG